MSEAYCNVKKGSKKVLSSFSNNNNDDIELK